MLYKYMDFHMNAYENMDGHGQGRHTHTHNLLLSPSAFLLHLASILHHFTFSVYSSLGLVWPTTLLSSSSPSSSLNKMQYKKLYYILANFYLF